MLNGGFFGRNDGCSDCSSIMRGLRLRSGTRQNPASFKPVMKAALRNMQHWISHNESPPDSVYLKGHVGDDGKFVHHRDEAGNALGGLRLPHMIHMLPDGKPSGAPLGIYTGLDNDFPRRANLFPWLGGTFTPFSTAELTQRYPTQKHYHTLVKRSADALLAERFILPEDHKTYLKAAEYWRHPGNMQ